MTILIVGLVSFILGVVVELTGEKFTVNFSHWYELGYILTILFMLGGFALGGVSLALVAGLCFTGAWSLTNIIRFSA